MIKVSIIIPVFNTSSYLNKCINSALNQSLKDIEIIVIDDASTDNSLSLLKQYQTTIKLINHHKNKGLGAARNSGLKTARGEYILFLDSDDYIEFDAAEKLYKIAKSQNLDILQSSYFTHQVNCFKQSPLLPIFKKPIKGIDYFKEHIFLELAVWIKIWKRTFLLDNNLFFKTGYYEDMLFTIKAFTIAKRINNINYPFYNYVIRKKSITQQKPTIKHVFDYTNVLTEFQFFFTNEELMHKNSNFPIAYMHYLVELSKLALLSKDKKMIKNVSSYVNNNKPRRNKIVKNKHMNYLKKRAIYFNPFIYTKLKLIYNTILKKG